MQDESSSLDAEKDYLLQRLKDLLDEEKKQVSKLRKCKRCQVLNINPTGQFLAPKLAILLKCLIDI